MLGCEKERGRNGGGTSGRSNKCPWYRTGPTRGVRVRTEDVRWDTSSHLS